MYKPERGAIVWRKHVMPYMKLDTGYMKEALASDLHVKYCRIVRRTLNGVKRWFVQLMVEGLPPVRKVYAPKCEVVGIDPPFRNDMYSQSLVNGSNNQNIYLINQEGQCIGPVSYTHLLQPVPIFLCHLAVIKKEFLSIPPPCISTISMRP